MSIDGTHFVIPSRGHFYYKLKRQNFKPISNLIRILKRAGKKNKKKISLPEVSICK